MYDKGGTMTGYRASFDAAVNFSDGSDLAVHRFRVGVPSAAGRRGQGR